MGHTPGPWFVREPDGDEHTEVYAEKTGAVCYPEPDDAHLISAAPEMLAALRRMREVFEELDDDWRHMDATYVDQLISSDGLHGCDQIIAKAEGRSDVKD